MTVILIQIVLLFILIGVAAFLAEILTQKEGDYIPMIIATPITLMGIVTIIIFPSILLLLLGIIHPEPTTEYVDLGSMFMFFLSVGIAGMISSWVIDKTRMSISMHFLIAPTLLIMEFVAIIKLIG